MNAWCDSIWAEILSKNQVWLLYEQFEWPSWSHLVAGLRIMVTNEFTFIFYTMFCIHHCLRWLYSTIFIVTIVLITQTFCLRYYWCNLIKCPFMYIVEMDPSWKKYYNNFKFNHAIIGVSVFKYFIKYYPLVFNILL